MATLARTRGARKGASLRVAMLGGRISRATTRKLIWVNLLATVLLILLDVVFHVF